MFSRLIFLVQCLLSSLAEQMPTGPLVMAILCSVLN
jgi:hypothetical protein